MAKVMIKCPKTNKPLSTGIDMPKQVFESSHFSNNAVSCPHCGGTHVGQKSDAYLEEGR